MSAKRRCSEEDLDSSPFTRTKQRKEAAVDHSGVLRSESDENTSLLEISDTKAAILYLRSLFPVTVFEGRVPPIVLKHQIYSIVSNRTTVDRELNGLWERNEVLVFQLIQGSDEFEVVLAEDYYSHAKQLINDNNRVAIEKLLHNVLPVCHDVSFAREVMSKKFNLSDEEITRLVNAGLLGTRDIGSYWLGIPGAGIFLKNFTEGRKAVIRIFKKTKYKEILQSDLEDRKINCFSKLGMQYHIYDILGADVVQRISTTSGPLLRLSERKTSNGKRRK